MMHMKGLKNYKTSIDLGTGNYGKVVEAIHTPSQTKVALKIISKENKNHEIDTLSNSCSSSKGSNEEAFFVNEGTLNDAKVEITSLQTLNHRNIIKLIEVAEDEDQVVLVLEHANSDLMSYMLENDAMSEKEARVVMHQLLQAVNHCHENMICHRDIKLENILISKNGTNSIKLCDFGLSDKMVEGQFLEESCGSIHYASPEIVTNSQYNGTEVDAWSCGVCLYAMITGNFPFSSTSDEKIAKKIKKGIFEIPYYLSVNAESLITRLLDVNPLTRWNVQKALDCNWFKEFPT